MLDRRQKEFLRDKTFHGNEIVPGTRRLCLMNLFLHNIGELDGEPSVERSDALISEPKRKVDYVLANPPFGKKSSMTITNGEGEEDKDALTYERQDFRETTSNKQLNFLQHIVCMLKGDHRAPGSGTGVLQGCGRRVATAVMFTGDTRLSGG